GAETLLDARTAGPPREDDWITHLLRAQIDMLRGDHEAAAARQRQGNALTGRGPLVQNDREAVQLTVEVELWAGRPADAVRQVRQVLAQYEGVPDLTAGCGQLLAG